MAKMNIQPLDLGLIRTCLMALVSFIILKTTNKEIYIPKHNRTFFFWRCIFGCASLNVIVVCLKLLPMSMVLVLFNTAPFWTALISFCMMKEKMTKIEMVVMFFSFVGVCMIILSKPVESETKNVDSSFFQTLIGSMLGLFSAAGFAFCAVAARKL